MYKQRLTTSALLFKLKYEYFLDWNNFSYAYSDHFVHGF